MIINLNSIITIAIIKSNLASKNSNKTIKTHTKIKNIKKIKKILMNNNIKISMKETTILLLNNKISINITKS